ncbi:MAG: hypothetical protein VB957_16285 [Pseudomonadales bacterium]
MKRWRGSIPFAGNWFGLNHKDNSDAGFIEKEELNKDRARILLDRYGIVFRELTLKELPSLHWSKIFRSLRLMELSGEVLSGYFFKDIPGPQFISVSAFRHLQMMQAKPVKPANNIFWLNAANPISPCGMGLELPEMKLPRRASSNHVVFDGGKVIMVSERRGKSLTFHISPDDEQLPAYLGVLRHLLYRSFAPMRKIEIESINDISARNSPYLQVLETCFDLIKDYKSVTLQREI